MTGAGGYLQNYVNGYAGLRYTGDGLALRPVLPPHGCESLALRGTTLIGLSARPVSPPSTPPPSARGPAPDRPLRHVLPLPARTLRGQCGVRFVACST